MQSISASYKTEIKKASRSFECRVTIGKNVYLNEDIVDIILETPQPTDGFTIGATTSQTLDLTLINKGEVIYSTNQIKVEIGLKVGATIEYILMGLYNIDEVVKTDYTTKFTAFDNMMKFETDYFSKLGSTATLQQIVNELATFTGIQFTGSLPSYNLSKLEGFTCREILSYVASICGGNAFITRDGKFTIVYPKDVSISITGDNYIDYKREEVNYKIGKVSCQVGEKIIEKGSLGTDSMDLQFENPWVTESILTDIYNKVKTIEYLGYTMKWQGDLSLDIGDIITCIDVKGIVRKLPILSQKINYTGGLTSEIGAKGETKNKNSFSSSGSNSNKINRVVTDLLIANEAIINKANIKDLEATNIRTQNLESKTAKIETAIIDVAYIKDLNVLNANITNLIVEDARINTALINKANITDLNAIKGHVDSLTANVANIDTLINGNLSSENIQVGGITGSSLNMDTIFVKDANMINVNISSLKAGDISTTKFRIKSDDGAIEIVGATQQFKDKNNRVRIQMGKDTQGNFNFILRGEDGVTSLIDHTGIKTGAIADDLIKENMIASDAVGEKQINYSSFTTGFNKSTNTSTLKATHIQLDNKNQTLDLAFNELKNQSDGTKSLTESNNTTIGVMQGEISTAINNTQIIKDGKTILLKDDYNRTVQTVNSSSETIGRHESTINQNTGAITNVTTEVTEVKKSLTGITQRVGATETNIGTVTTNANKGIEDARLAKVQADKGVADALAASNKAGQSLIDAKAYTNAEITTVTTKVTNANSEINQLKNKIELKVEATDVTTAISNISIGGRNLVKGSGEPIKSTAYNIKNYPLTTTIAEGTQVTVSIKGQLGTGRTSWALYNSGGMIKMVDLLPSDRNSKGVYTKTFNWTIGGALNTTLYVYQMMSATIVESSIEWIKLELGNKATDYTIAQEDVDKAITDTITINTTNINSLKAEILLETDSIKQSVSSVESKVTTVTATANKGVTDAKGALDKANAVDGRVTTLNTTISTTNNKVAGIETNLTNITSRVSAAESATTKINGTITSMETRLKNAEIKITDSSIISTVQATVNTAKQDAINSANSTTNGKLNSYSTTSQMNSAISQSATSIKQEVSNTYITTGNANNIFATKASMDLTATQLKLDFSSSGGYNFVKNSNFQSGQDYWDKVGAPATFAVGKYRANGYGENVLALTTTASGQQASQAIEGLNIGRRYTISCYIYIGSGSICIMESDQWNGAYTKGTGWQWLSFTFIPTVSNIIIFIGSNSSAPTGSCHVTAVSITQGNQRLAWTPHPNEVYSGSTSIDKDGIKYTHADGTYTKMGKDGFAWHQANAQYAYHCLTKVGVFNIKSYGNGNWTKVKIQLPNEFKGKMFEPQCALAGFEVGAANVSIVTALIDTYNIAEGWFIIKVFGSNNQGGYFNNINVTWVVTA